MRRKITPKAASAMLVALALETKNVSDLVTSDRLKTDKPKFTDAELAHLRSLPKKQRKAEVRRLTALHGNDR